MAVDGYLSGLKEVAERVIHRPGTGTLFIESAMSNLTGLVALDKEKLAEFVDNCRNFGGDYLSKFTECIANRDMNLEALEPGSYYLGWVTKPYYDVPMHLTAALLMGNVGRKCVRKIESYTGRDLRNPVYTMAPLLLTALGWEIWEWSNGIPDSGATLNTAKDLGVDIAGFYAGLKLEDGLTLPEAFRGGYKTLSGYVRRREHGAP
ncbi:MAG: hypothetical protein ACP5E4_01520 [Candidatus Aenigmatarchaeota archaeon]